MTTVPQLPESADIETIDKTILQLETMLDALKSRKKELMRVNPSALWEKRVAEYLSSSTLIWNNTSEITRALGAKGTPWRVREALNGLVAKGILMETSQGVAAGRPRLPNARLFAVDRRVIWSQMANIMVNCWTEFSELLEKTSRRLEKQLGVSVEESKLVDTLSESLKLGMTEVWNSEEDFKTRYRFVWKTE